MYWPHCKQAEREIGTVLIIRLILVYSTLIQPWAILLIQPLDVVQIAIAQLAEQGAHRQVHDMLQMVRSFAQESEEPKVLGAVLRQRGKAARLHQLLFAGEMHACEFDKAVQQFA